MIKIIVISNITIRNIVIITSMNSNNCAIIELIIINLIITRNLSMHKVALCTKTNYRHLIILSSADAITFVSTIGQTRMGQHCNIILIIEMLLNKRKQLILKFL